GAGSGRRARTALKPPRAVDPLPYIVVVLEGGTPAPEDAEAPGQPVRYTIIGEAFEQPILPVVVGSIVEVKNGGARSPRLYVAGEDGLIPGDPVSPKAERKTRPIAEPNRAYVIRDRESAHLTGRVVAFPHRYFARVGPGGKFEIEGVAPGTWRVRVWYEDGWVDMPSQTIEVEARREARVKQIALPARLTTTPANWARREDPMFWSKIWFFLVAVVAAVALTLALLMPRPAERATLKAEQHRL